MTKVECPDDETLIAYTTDQSDRIFQVYLPILPKHIWGKYDYKTIADQKFDAPLVGTGPYTLAEWKTGQFMRFVRNPNYWGKQGFADEVVLQIFSSADTMVQALKSGELDYAHDVNADQLKALQSDAGHQDRRRLGQWLDAARVQHLRHGDRQDHQGRGPVDQGAARPGVPRRPRLRRRQADARRQGPRRLRRRGQHHRAAGPRPVARRADQPRTFDIELAKQKLDAAGYKLDASGNRLDKDGKPITLRLYMPDSSDELPEGGPVHQGLVRRARDQGPDQGPRQRHLDRSPPAARGRRQRQPGQVRHRAVGLDRQPGPERAAPDLPLRRDRQHRPTATTATRTTTSCTTRNRSCRAMPARRSWPRCRT